MKNVYIIGGGIAGLVCSIQLRRAGIACTVIEKKAYPFHRVCGEYISMEATPFLKSLNLFPEAYNPPILTRFQLSSIAGKSSLLPLDLGGFGISRYTYDHFLYKRALAEGVTVITDTNVDAVDFKGDHFVVNYGGQLAEADVVIGAHGKRSTLDAKLNRSFMQHRSPYVGVKYHIKRDHPAGLIALHNFRGGYCGISNIEDGKTNLCYLTRRDNIRVHGSIEVMERAVLHQNPILKDIFTTSEFLFEKPEVINEISFETKAPIENHLLMIGDAAGMITPLCGNGMAMAIHSSKIASDLVVRYMNGDFNREALEAAYARQWRKLFAQRLWVGRQVQRLFGQPIASNIAINLALYSKPIANQIIKNTHGQPF